MIGKVLRFGAKAAWYYTRYRARKHRTEAAVALGVLGAAVTATCAIRDQSRRSAMHGKVVLVTGGSRGLGLEIARAFGRHGAHLSIAARDPEEMQRALQFLEKEKAIANLHTALCVECDVTDPEACRNLVATTMRRYGRIDVLINNAGVIDVAPFQDQPLSAFHEAMDVNFFGALHMVQAALPHMEGRRGGRIVNIASIGGKIAVPHMLPYVASKYALVGLSQGLRAELSRTGISVTTVNPGLMRTGSHGHAKFGGNAQREFQWFSMGAMLPGASISARAAARKIYRATVDGAAEITITPQAWLAARIVGVAPGCAAQIAGLVNRFLMPLPNGNSSAVPGAALQQTSFRPLRTWSEHLQKEHNATI